MEQVLQPLHTYGAWEGLGQVSFTIVRTKFGAKDTIATKFPFTHAFLVKLFSGIYKGTRYLKIARIEALTKGI